MSRSTISTFQLFAMYPDEESARLGRARLEVIPKGKSKSGGRNGGRKRSDEARCPCGQMSARRAKVRFHRCEAAQ